MRNPECYDVKLNDITTIKDKDIILRSSIPVEIYLQEADNLYNACQVDKELLIDAGMDWTIVEDIPIRSAALREAIAIWMSVRFTKTENKALLRKKTQKLYTLRTLLLHHFRFAFRNNLHIRGSIRAIAGSNARTAMIQDINDLSVLGKNNPAELKAINFRMHLLDTAASMSKEVADLLATSTVEENCNNARKIRDQAFTLLKLAVDVVYDCGRFLFWRDETRKWRYTSAYLRGIRNNRPKKSAVKEPVEAF